MPRHRLPNRRRAIVVDLEHGGFAYSASIGFDQRGRPREVFARSSKPDSAADLIADDAGVVLSLALQHGIMPAQLRHSVGRLHGRPASLIGVLIDLVAEHGAEP